MAQLNREEALKRLDGETELYDHMAGYFLRDYVDYPEKIRRHIAEEDREAYVITHSLKNIAASLGADELSRRALDLEVLLKSGSYGNTGAVLKRLLEEFHPVMDEVGLLAGGGKTSGAEGDGPAGWTDFPSLLEGLTEGLGSFCPEKVNEAIARLDRSEEHIPESFREELNRIREMARDFRYMEGEDLLLELKKRVLE